MASVAAALLVAAASVTTLAAQSVAAAPTITKPGNMTQRATGSFEVKVTQQTASEIAQSGEIMRLTIDKEFRGDLAGTSKGEMLAAGTESTGSGVYVAVERVTATLAGRTGKFVLMHAGTRNKTSQDLSVTVAPESGTGGLAGIAGKMTIIIEGGKHDYVFEYTLPPSKP